MAALIGPDPEHQEPGPRAARGNYPDAPEPQLPPAAKAAPNAPTAPRSAPSAASARKHSIRQTIAALTDADQGPEQHTPRSTILPALPAASGGTPGPGLVLTLETSGGEPDLSVVDYLAHYAMALSHCLVEAGSPPARLELRAGPADPGEDGQRARVALRVSGQAGTLDEPSFEALARVAALGCRVNRDEARGLDIQLEARLAQPRPAPPPTVTPDLVLVEVLRDELTFLRSELASRTAEVLHKDQLIARLAERPPLPPAPGSESPTRPWWAFWRQ